VRCTCRMRSPPALCLNRWMASGCVSTSPSWMVSRYTTTAWWRISRSRRTFSTALAETKEAREALRQVVILVLDGTWAKGSAGPYDLDPRSARAEIVYDKIQTLSPRDESERLLKSEALSMAKDLGHIRWLIYAQGASTVSKPMLIVMVFWLTIVFLSWGLMAPPNTTIIVTLLVSALSVSGAIFLILEMYSPYQGWIRVSDAPLRAALAHLGH